MSTNDAGTPENGEPEVEQPATDTSKQESTAAKGATKLPTVPVEDAPARVQLPTAKADKAAPAKDEPAVAKSEPSEPAAAKSEPSEPAPVKEEPAAKPAAAKSEASKPAVAKDQPSTDAPSRPAPAKRAPSTGETTELAIQTPARASSGETTELSVQTARSAAQESRPAAQAPRPAATAPRTAASTPRPAASAPRPAASAPRPQTQQAPYDQYDDFDDEPRVAQPVGGPPVGGPPKSAGRQVRKIWWPIGGLALLLILGYVGTALWEGDRISSGTTVGGVDVGGLGKDEAAARLTTEAAKVSKLPVTVSLDKDRVEIQPASAGLGLDVEKSLAGLTDRGFGPGDVFGYFTGGGDKPAVTKANPATLAEAIDKATRTVITGNPVDGKVSFENGKVEVVRSKPGQGVDSDALAAQIGKEWPAKRAFSTQVSEREGRLKNAEIDRFVKEFGDKAMSGDLTVTDGKVSTKLTPGQLSAVLSVKSSGGKLTPSLDSEKLADKIMSLKPELATPARNAKVQLVSGQPKVTPSVDGTEIDRAKLGPAVIAALTTDERTATIATKPVKAKVTTEQVQALDAKNVVSEFRSRFPTGPSNAARTKNIRVALSILNGQVVGAGEQFSLVKALGGEMTAAQGYVEAPTIQDGHERAAMGGGVSQVSTTVYNTAFFAGVQLDEHKPHSFWIPRYPMGREATLWIPDLDNKWTNTTGAPILIEAGVQGNEVVMRFYGKKTFTVETTTGPQRSFTQPKTIYDNHPGCIRVPPQRGFTVDVKRVVKQGGTVVKNETLTTTYKAANNIICGPPPSGGSTAPPPGSTNPPTD
ncbi:VanW family protein [Luteipulveratus mongoliensis]|uniref:YoaR-like putative peptidoglycan binding domain-containing protein n=1 Tax=Luteipulveratus mongoliensis TaxID=571913 RepID=A0A0K1JLR0_9MICO|nr:VanW family protein [Luteipulveratus mongoliensis]AKU17659.1 hypothetical protein VV02_20440 [Luteipulveratus mongoliensis]